METRFDIIVIGAGIAGASAAARLAETHRVLVLEMEERPGYHSTGRSAAMFVQVAGTGEPRGERAEHSPFAAPKAANVVAIAPVPLRPTPASEGTDLVRAGGVPRFGDDLRIRQ